MFRFNLYSHKQHALQLLCFNTSYVSVQSDEKRLSISLVDGFNTSYVSVQYGMHKHTTWNQEFQYIICFGSIKQKVWAAEKIR